MRIYSYSYSLTPASGQCFYIRCYVYEEPVTAHDGDGSISADEIKAAMAEKMVADKVRNLFIKHESEWVKRDTWPRLEQELKNMPNLYKYVLEVTNKMAWIEQAAAVVGDTKPWFIHPAGMMRLVVDPIADDMDDRWLIVSQGQLTFNAEGNDIESSQFFSRMIHWPGNSLSGVTIGRGYDLGDRSQEEVYNDLQSAGVPHDIATIISNGARLKGDDASSYVSENRARTLISRKAQFKLFEIIYPIYVSRAKSNYERWTTDHEISSVNIPDISTADKVQWHALDAKIKDVIVDLVYQGFTKGPNPMIYGMLNDRERYAEYIVGNSSLRQYEPGRKRAKSLRGD